MTGVLWIGRMRMDTSLRVRETEIATEFAKHTRVVALDRTSTINRPRQGTLQKISFRMRMACANDELIEDGPIARFKMPISVHTEPWLNRLAAEKNEARIATALTDYDCDSVFHSSPFYFLPDKESGARHVHFDVVDNYYDSFGTDLVGRSRRDFHREQLLRADSVSAASLCMRDRMAEITGRHDILYAPNCPPVYDFANADPNIRKESRKQLGVGDRQVFGFIGNHAAGWDGMERLVDAFLRAREHNDNIALLIVGPESDKVTKPKGLGTGAGVYVVGPVPSEQVHRYFLASDVGVHPYDPRPDTEVALPLNVLEFGAAQRPVIANNLRELTRQDLPHVTLIEPTVEAWVEAFLNPPTDAHPLPKQFAWPTVTQQIMSAMGIA